jgi:NCS2 family nucleobase:cation symporter-2
MTKAKNDYASIYELNGRPNLGAAVPIGLQHVFAMFIGNISPILVLSGLIGATTGAPIITVEQRMLMLQCCMFASGIATLLQIYPIKIGGIQMGAGLPIVMGTSTAFVPTLSSIGIEYGINVILGSVIVASIVEVLMGVFSKYLRKAFSPIVIGSVLLSIGLSLLPVGVMYFAGGAGPQNAFNRQQTLIAQGMEVPANVAALASQYASTPNIIMGLAVFLTIILIMRFGKGAVKVSAIFIGIIVGYILAIILGQISFTSVVAAKVVAAPIPLAIKPAFEIGPIIAMSLMVAISGVETMGHVNGMTVAVWNRPAENKEVQGGLIADALGNVLAALFGSLPNTSFGQNIGMVCMTKVVNKVCFLIAAVVLILAGFSPKVGAILSIMPASVLGGAVITVFAMIMLNGIRMIARAGFSERNVLILALTFGVGYAIGINRLLVGTMPRALQYVFTNPTIAVCITSVALNLIFPPSKEERQAAHKEIDNE